MRPPTPPDKEAAEDEALTKRLNRETKFTRLQQSLSATSEIIKIQEEANAYLRKIETERVRVSDLDNEIAESQTIIVEQRRKMGGASAAKGNDEMITRQVRHFEGRLDKSLVKFNGSLKRNKVLRENIDTLRRERVVFDGVYKKIEKELHEKKKEMAAIIEDSKNAYQTRDKAASEQASLKALAQHDQAEFEREWDKLGKAMEDNLKLRETLGRVAPGAIALAVGNNVRALGSRSAPGGPHSRGQQPSQSTPLSPGGFSRNSVKGAAQLEKALDRIRIASRLDDDAANAGEGMVYQVVDKFLKTEDKNFRLFNFVNGLNAEVERLELLLVATKGEVEQFKGQGLSADAERKKALVELAGKLEHAKANEEAYEAQALHLSDSIASLKAGIQVLFARLSHPGHRDSDNGPSDAEVLGNQGVTEMNMHQYLGIIEQRVCDMFQQHCESQQPGQTMEVGELMANLRLRQLYESGEAAPQRLGGGGRGTSPTGGVEGLGVKPPAMDDLSDHGDDSDNEDNERPLTRGEVHKRTSRTIKGLSGASNHKGKERH